MGGNTIESIKKLLDLAFVYLHNNEIEKIDKVIQKLQNFDFSAFSDIQKEEILRQIEELISSLDAKKKNILHQLDSFNSVKKYKF